MIRRDWNPLDGSLRVLPQRTPPPELSGRLRVLASRESLRRRRRATLGALLNWWGESVSLLFNNLMRPVAVPFVGGVVSAVILFSALAPSLAIQRHVSRDVPSPIFTEPAVQTVFAMPDSDEDMVVEVWINEQGRVVDYAIPHGQGWAADPTLVKSVQNTLLCTKFTPATWFGQPASGKALITFRRSLLEVRG